MSENNEYDAVCKEDGLFLPEFEKENLLIELNSTKSKNDSQVKKEIFDIQERIKQTSDKILYHWKKVQITFPPSITGICNRNDSTNNLSEYEMKDLFNVPRTDELETVATGDDGKTKRLNSEQFEQIKRNGEFEVDSINFPGLKHKWRLAKWLQLGYVRANAVFFNILSKALYLMIITAKRRITSRMFSLRASARAWWVGFYQLIDILIGLPAMEVVPYNDKLKEKEQIYMVAELLIDDKEQSKYEKFCTEFDTRYKESKKWNAENPTNYMTQLDAPSFYKTPDGTPIDLRLYNNNLINGLMPMLEKLMSFNSETDKEWLSTLRKKLITKYQAEGKSVDEITEIVQENLLEEYIKRAFDRVLSNQEINEISNGVGKLLVDQAKAYLIMTRTHESVGKMINDHADTYRKSLISKHPVKSNIKEWLDEQVMNEMKSFKKTHTYTEYEMALKELADNNLTQAAYFLNREMQFRKQEEPKLIQQFKKVKEPVSTFTLYKKIWFPRNWIVKKVNRTTGTSERVKPVVFSDPFSFSTDGYGNYGEIYYTLDREITYTNSTRYPFWRWTNFFLRTYCYVFNAFFYLFLVIPFCSPLSFRALFGCSPFYPDKEINPKTGRIHPRQSSKTLTFASRVRAVWRHVRVSRERFEMVPDRGLIGKSIQRVFNRIWNYLIKGLCGTLLLTIIFPTACTFVSVFSLLAGLLTPIWYPIASVLHHLCFFIIYDWDSPYNRKKPKVLVVFQIFVFRFLICGLLQPVAALFTTFIACPVASFFILLFACIRKSCRAIWDNFMFYAILKVHAKVPSYNTFVARRTAGPGLASNYFYQITAEQALAALEAHIELKILDSYINRVEQIINMPLNEFVKFYAELGVPFSYTLSIQHETTYGRLVKETDTHLKLFRDAASRKRTQLRHSLPNNDLSKIRLMENDLRLLLAKSSEIVQYHFKNAILKYQKKSEKTLFREHQMDELDWTSLAGSILEEIFGNGFLIPLEDTDNYFHLDVNHLDLSKYTEMIVNSELRDDLDMVMAKYNPKKSRVFVSMPNKSASIYNPNNNSYVSDRVNVPTCLPSHKGIVALLVHNRDNPENEIKYDSFYSVETMITRQYEQ